MISLLLQFDQETWIVSASKLGVIMCRIWPTLWLQPVLTVSWNMPKLQKKKRFQLIKLRPKNMFLVTTYLCPSSWAIVCARVIPLSSLTLQDLSGLHIPATLAIPKVEQPDAEQIFFRVIKMATSWCRGSSSLLGLSVFCHLKYEWKTSMKILRRNLVNFRRLLAKAFQSRPSYVCYIQVLVTVFIF